MWAGTQSVGHLVPEMQGQSNEELEPVPPFLCLEEFHKGLRTLVMSGLLGTCARTTEAVIDMLPGSRLLIRECGMKSQCPC